MSLRRLATQAARAAARLRADSGIEPSAALCPFDLAERIELRVRFVSAPTLEGMYSPDPIPTILVTSDRPAGRRRYTCAHEIGHHVFGHGARLDELESESDSDWSADEFLAHRFASALLMPKLAVDSAFARRGLSVSAPSSEAVFVVAQDLGVGYATLIGHLERTISCLSSTAADSLRRTQLSRLRAQIAGFVVEHDVVVVDDSWGQRPVDVEIGDVISTPNAATVEGVCAVVVSSPTPHLRAVAAGIGAVVLHSGRRVPLRVSRREYAGLARYRHLEEADDSE